MLNTIQHESSQEDPTLLKLHSQNIKVLLKLFIIYKQ